MRTIVRKRKTLSRGRRAPQHMVYARWRPHQVQPLGIMPLLAGDSLHDVTFEARCISDPVVSSVTGWWLDVGLFYVRMTDLTAYDAIQSWMVNPAGGAIAGMSVATNAWTYYRAGTNNGPDWLLACMEPIVRDYYKSETETWDGVLLDGVPLAGRVHKHWADQARFEAEFTTTPVSDYDSRWAAYQELIRDGLFTGDFREYLAMEGVEVPPQLLDSATHSYRKRPELVGYTRQFAFPVLSQDATSGALSSIMSWQVKVSSRKAMYCDVPGFLVPVVCARPKSYLAAQASVGAGLLNEGRLWRSSVDQDTPQETLTRVAPGGATEGVLSTANPYVVDTDGLLHNGDQFVVGTPPHTVAALGTTVMSTHYPTGNEIDAWFATANKRVTLDGYFKANISTRRSATAVNR